MRVKRDCDDRSRSRQTEADLNVPSIIVNRLVSQSSGMLKAPAPVNVYFIVVTLELSHAEMSPLKPTGKKPGQLSPHPFEPS